MYPDSVQKIFRMGMDLERILLRFRALRPDLDERLIVGKAQEISAALRYATALDLLQSWSEMVAEGRLLPFEYGRP